MTTTGQAVSEAAQASGEGPVLSLITKRVRAIKKKLEKVRQLEEFVIAGKSINPEQQAVLDSKVVLGIQMEELEKLRPLLGTALKEEKAAWVPPPPPKAKKSEQPAPPPANAEADKLVAEKEAALSAAIQQHQEELAQLNASEAERVRSVIELMYFSQVFDIRQPPFQTFNHLQQMERSSCLSYDYIDARGASLTHADLDLIAAFGKLVASRPQGVAISHKDALDSCHNLALKWMSKSQEMIPELNCSFSDLVARLDRILSSDYFTQKPVVQTLNDQPGREAAEALQRVQLEHYGGPPMGAPPGVPHMAAAGPGGRAVPHGHFAGPPVSGAPGQPVVAGPMHAAGEEQRPGLGPGAYFMQQLHQGAFNRGGMPPMPQFGIVAAEGMGGMMEGSVMGPALNFTSDSSLEIDDAAPSSSPPITSGAPPAGPPQPIPQQVGAQALHQMMQPMPPMGGHGPVGHVMQGQPMPRGPAVVGMPTAMPVHGGHGGPPMMPMHAHAKGVPMSEVPSGRGGRGGGRFEGGGRGR
eukprot:CAMPEP_0118934212 /NCGR_PEP_ID=MMETSP1169-20130426/13698_1 /TAXON_ID=36882 /ORGANISM="Pyramimonas obovata, Strain CCMP722" /LENGTH=524 /DNA_ID=CAMNT_0006877089 /DNA_START=167 /DNA_END=1738 /DNA_ORIENTATION=+